jgi:ribosomal-protein-alanine N-acetyltransferase
MTIVRETDRLILRRMVLADAEFILELVNEPAWLQFIGDKGVRTRDDAIRYISTGPIASYDRFGFGLYVVERKAGGVPIGICGLLKRESLDDVDLGFALLTRFHGNGFAYEAAVAALAHGTVAFGLDRIVAITAPDNHASIGLLERLGFAFERMLARTADGPERKLFAIAGTRPSSTASASAPRHSAVELPSPPRHARATRNRRRPA